MLRFTRSRSRLPSILSSSFSVLLPFTNKTTIQGRAINSSSLKTPYSGPFSAATFQGSTEAVFGFKNYEEIPLRRLNRLRIPDSRLKVIASHVNQTANFSGTARLQRMEKDRSDSFMSILHYILYHFGSSIVKRAEGNIDHGPLSSHGRVDYRFQTYFGLDVLLTEFKAGLIKDHPTKNNHVPQLISACTASKTGPIFGLLTNGEVFDIFCSDVSVDPPTLERLRPLGPTGSFQQLHLDYSSRSGFVESLRLVSECLETVFLIGYIRMLNTGLSNSLHLDTVDTPAWAEAKRLASEALEEGIEATRQADSGHLIRANDLAEHASEKFRNSLDLVLMPPLVDWVDLKDILVEPRSPGAGDC